ncbi:MAG: glycosyltransferase family 4 protein [Sphaerochaetaceae bacterium]|nr:glycosyltransferase family 4 protein [Sphaerochaetaceae bacterium]
MKGPVHIIHIPRRFVVSHWGGSETFVAEVSRRMVSHGFDVKIFTSKALSTVSHETYQGVPIHRFTYVYPYAGLSTHAKSLLDQKAGNLFSFSLLWALLFRKDLDLIHLHTGKRMGGIGRLCARVRRIPYIISLHGGNLAVPEDERDTWVEPTKGLFEWGKVLGMLVGSRRVLADASAIICVGKDEYDAMVTQYPDAYIEYLPNGVDIQRFETGDGAAFRRTYGISEDRFVCLTMARLDVQKNQLGLIRQLPALLEKNPLIHLLLIGPATNREYAASLRQEADRLGLTDHITIIEGLPYQGSELVDAYKASSCFVLPSLHEPFGMVVLEAWASGLPVAVSQRGGLASLVTQDTTGLFFDPASEAEDENSIASTVARLSQDRAFAQSLAEAGRQEAAASYSWDSITARLETIYQRVYEHSIR